jgi:hypothetical protein
MSQNCRIKPIIFAVTMNGLNKELRLSFNHKRDILITESYFDYYKENYDSFKEVSMSIGKVWFFKSKTN